VWPEMDELDACIACPVPETDRPAESDDVGQVMAGAFHSAMTHGLAVANGSSTHKAA